MPRETTTDGAKSAYAAVEQALATVPQLVGRGEGVGSNSWVVSGDHTASGKPLLANDPHLGIGQPGIWIQNSLHCRTVAPECPLDVSGFSFAGVPGVIIGHNADIAWGFTNLGPDVSDFYLERVVGQTYLRDGAWKPMTSREETIKVAGGADQHITVRATEHGPIMTDVLQSAREAGSPRPHPARRGTRPRPTPSRSPGPACMPGRTADAIIGLDKATQLRASSARPPRSFAVPAQNLVYADTEGHIGYQAPGQIPVRRAAIPKSPPGYWPAPGWDSSYDWTGFVRLRGPARGPRPAGRCHRRGQPGGHRRAGTPFLTTEWDHGWRSTRIAERLEEPRQGDAGRHGLGADGRHRPLRADSLVPALLGVPLEAPEGEPEQQDLLDFTEGARDLLRGLGPDDPGRRLRRLGRRRVLQRRVAQPLRAALRRRAAGRHEGRRRATAGARPCRTCSPTRESEWWDNKLTPNVTEGRDEILRQALVQARLELTRELGKDPQQWDWGKLHRITLQHKVLGGESVPGPVRWLFNEGPYDMPGGSAIVNANGWDASEGYEVNWAPSMRMVVDLSDLDGSTWINQTGVSGHATDDHYADQISDWVAGRQRPWPFSLAGGRRHRPRGADAAAGPADLRALRAAPAPPAPRGRRGGQAGRTPAGR